VTPRATHPRPPAVRALGLALGLTLAAPPARAQAPAYPQDRDPLQTDSVPLTAPDPAAAKIASEQAPTVTVRLRLVEAVPGGLQDLPAAALAGARLALEAAHEPGAARLTTGVVPGQSLAVAPGVWIARLEVPGYLPLAVQQFALPGASESTWTLQLARPQVAVDLRLSPPRRARGATLRLIASDRSPPPVVERRILGPTTTVMLTTGTWQLAVDSPRYQANRVLTITARQGPIDVVLNKRARLSPPPRFTRDKKFMLGVLASFAATYAIGVGLILGGSARASRIADRNDALLEAEGLDPTSDARPDPAALARIDAAYSTRSYHRDLRVVSDLSIAGVHVALGGLGAALAVLPVALGSRRRAAYIEIGVGAAFLAGGSAWLATHLRRRDELLAPDATRVTKAQFEHLTGSQIGASMLTGAGIGLVTFSTLALLVANKRRKAIRSDKVRLDAAPGPGLVGGAIRADF
jgi:hypothetical protein